jgi:hypothetical protein
MAKKVFVTGATCLIASPVVSKLTLFLSAACAHGILQHCRDGVDRRARFHHSPGNGE